MKDGGRNAGTQKAEVSMTTVLLTVWCLSSFLVAPLVGRAIRCSRAEGLRMRLEARSSHRMVEVA